MYACFYACSPLAGGAFSFFVCLYYIVGIRRFEFQSMIEKLLDIKHIFLVVIPCQLVVGMLGEIILVRQKKAVHRAAAGCTCRRP